MCLGCYISIFWVHSAVNVLQMNRLILLCSIWSANIQCKRLVKLELSMPYENCEEDYGNDFTQLLDQDCLLDLPPSLSVALLSIPFKPKEEDESQTPASASLEGFSPQHLQSLVLTTGILRQNNAKVNLSRCLGLADPPIQCTLHTCYPRDQASLFSAVLVRQTWSSRTLALTYRRGQYLSHDVQHWTAVSEVRV